MSVSMVPDLVVPEDVMAEVGRKSAQIEFDNYCKAVARHFPDPQCVELYLRADPDEDDRNWVIFKVTFPADMSFEEVRQRRLRFYEDFDKLRPQISQPICVLAYRFA